MPHRATTGPEFLLDERTGTVTLALDGAPFARQHRADAFSLIVESGNRVDREVLSAGELAVTRAGLSRPGRHDPPRTVHH